MERVTQKDECGYYLVGDGIYGDWGTPEKFRGDDVDRLAAIEDILGDKYDLDELKTAMWCKETVGMAFSEDTAPVERLRELWFADKDGRCVVLEKRCNDG